MITGRAWGRVDMTRRRRLPKWKAVKRINRMPVLAVARMIRSPYTPKHLKDYWLDQLHKKGLRLRDIGQTRMSSKQYMINQMTPSETELIEEHYGKPVEKLTTEVIRREFEKIKKTYPELEW